MTREEPFGSGSYKQVTVTPLVAGPLTEMGRTLKRKSVVPGVLTFANSNGKSRKASLETPTHQSAVSVRAALAAAPSWAVT